MRSESDLTAEILEPVDMALLEPVYPFNEPGQEIRLYAGRFAGPGVSTVSGAVWMSCGSQFRVRWKLEGEVPTSWQFRAIGADEVTIELARPGGNVEVTGRYRTLDDGTLNGSTLGRADSVLSHVIVHWMNLPDVQRGRGRWRFSVGEWDVVLEPRPDHETVWEALGFDPRIAMTHVMSITRGDGALFIAEEVRVMLRALHFGVSFAFGRWVPPALPVGFSPAGVAVWEEWGPLFCDPGRNASMAWLDHEHVDDLQALLDCVLAAFEDPQREDIARHLLSRAVEANHTGRVEQRIMTAFPAIEWLCWVELKLSGKMSGAKYKELSTASRIETLLSAANIPTDVDPGAQPVLAAYASAKSETGTPLSGAQVTTRVRHQLVHAKSPFEEVYTTDGLLTEAWLLTRHYLVLLLLKWLGYAGRYQAALGPSGSSGHDGPVPCSVRADPDA
ncbi:hypothetical protein AB0E59_05915 [Lentzea sp. NPDC034063]|uniref:hypothetical protein n=1 Tax=unclassified Lentzea TaxID=2643253 RepID=UPI0033D28CA9